ncbi:MAG: hypothetical protein JXA82_02155 [Sedimentisphaerales bacterium]|nr:hypothetical protein [Sedimentisphaerales bacterium]
MPRGDGTGPTGIGGGGGGRRRRFGRGGRSGGSSSPRNDGVCTCPNCGYKQPHIMGSPCNQQSCPQCGIQMIRE